MHVLRVLQVVLAAEVATALVSSPAAFLVPGALVRSPPAVTHFARADCLSFRALSNSNANETESTGNDRDILFSGNRNGTLSEKAFRSSAQHGLMGCPEMFKEPLLPYSVCGSELKRSPGKCADPNGSGWICQCIDKGPNGLATSLVTATASQQTATGTFELDTMTEYGSLRQSITISTTATVTTTGDTGLETVAVVVLAGGVSWFLADASGGAAAVAALEAPADAPNHEDDRNCPDPKDKCKNCGGEEQMCTTGKDAWCAREADNCPAEGSKEQPECIDDACEGKDEKCMTGENEECDCKKPQCPDLRKYSFWCSECGGKDSDGKCRGDPEEDYNFQGCECRDEPDWSLGPPPLRRPNALKHWLARAKLHPPSPSPPSPSPQAECDLSGSSQVPYNVFSPGVYSIFCNTINGGDRSKAFTQTVDSHGKVIQGTSKEKRDVSRRTPPPNPETYNAYNFTLSCSGGDESCPSNYPDTFYNIAEGPCGHVAGEQNIMAPTATLDTGCGMYSCNISAPASVPSPPAPQPSLDCHQGNVPLGYQQLSRDAASDMTNLICTELVDNKVVLSQSGSLMPPASMFEIFEKSGKDIAANGATLVINPHWALGGCQSENKPQDVDFGSMQVSDCVRYFMTAIDGCPEFSNSGGGEFWKWGGTSHAAYAFWSVQASA